MRPVSAMDFPGLLSRYKLKGARPKRVSIPGFGHKMRRNGRWSGRIPECGFISFVTVHSPPPYLPTLGGTIDGLPQDWGRGAEMVNGYTHFRHTHMRFQFSHNKV